MVVDNHLLNLNYIVTYSETGMKFRFFTLNSIKISGKRGKSGELINMQSNSDV